VGAYGNERSSDGSPVFFEQNIPSTGQVGNYQPRVYFGEQSPEYSIVGAPAGSEPRELDYPDDSTASQQANTTYTGNGGVRIGSLFRKLLYAMKFHEQNILLSGGINQDSKIMYDRTPRVRVEKVAPYLTLDGDPYPAVVDGRIKWIVDAYTTSSHYPYSKTEVLQDATSDSITENTSSVVALDNQRINYMRNSVKATVDAYDGSVQLYAWDESDPVLKSWQKIFPATIKPLSAINGSLMQHLRYPEDLFKVQRDLLQTYHVTDAGGFYNGQDYWEVPDDPTRSSSELQPPYYLTLQMPGQTSPTFSLSSTFVPKGRTRNVLTGFLAVDADAGDQGGQPRTGYGQLRLLQLPREVVVPGPGQVQNNFNSDTEVAQQIRLLQGQDSTVERGNLLTLPLAGGLLYVQPVYVRGGGSGSYPLLRKVVVAFGDQIGFADTLDDALDQVFGNTAGTGGTPPSGGTGGNGGNGGAQANAAVQAALQDAQKALQDSAAALKAGDFAAYGEAQKRLSDAIQAAVDAEAAAAKSAKASPSPSASASPKASASPSG
jgi:uncharacterized membrane protein (UPF0182 family)